jgi:carboxyl-terminal processing protease
MKWVKRLFILILLVVVFGVGYYVGQETKVCPYCAPTEVDFSILWEAWHKLSADYVDPNKLDTQKMVWGATAGMVSSLGDPYTVFFNPQEAKTFLEDVSGQFEGIGIEIGVRDNQLQVIAPLEGTPAEKAGLRPGDRIVEIDGKPSADISIEEAVSLIRGPKGTDVVLGIMREGWESSKDFTIERGVIIVPSLKWEIKDGNVAYIKLYQFSENLRSDFQDAAFEILNSTDADRVVLDLRSNPGGYLEVAQYVAGWFLARGQTVVIEDFGQGKEQDVHEADGNSRFSETPVVVLINGGTASASEILAAALRDNRQIKLIGETSFGKGSVQKLEDLADGSSLKVTIADWLTPKGEHITGTGLEPDIEVEMTDDDYNQNKDPQLDKALEIIKGM